MRRNRNNAFILFFATFALLASVFGCANGESDNDADDDASGDVPRNLGPDFGEGDDANDDPDPDAETPDPFGFVPPLFGPIVAGWEYALIPGEPAPDNPSKGSKTPDEYNVIPLFRFRLQQDIDRGGPPRPVRTIFILMPGYTAGATQLFPMARWIVEQSQGLVEVWVPDRRHALLEDQRGMDLAERLHDPWIAYDYYFRGARIDGRRYVPLHPRGPKTDMMSEWGLDLWMRDLRRLVHLVPRGRRAVNVVMGGDSRGALMAQTFAAWRFDDGVYGAEEIAGLVLWDGGYRPRVGMTESDYIKDLRAIRQGEKRRFEAVGLTGASLYMLEILGMAIQDGFVDPNNPSLGSHGVFGERGPLELLFPLLTRFHNITMTNEAMLGMVIDSDTIPANDFLAHAGKLSGGPVAHGLLGDYPTDPASLYTWSYWDECDPRELVDLKRAGRMFYEGPSNFTDPYYSSRLALDMDVAGWLETEGSWRENYFDISSGRVDVPIFAISSAMWADSNQLDLYKTMIAPVRGQIPGEELGRDEYGYVRHVLPDWSHLDALMVEPEVNPMIPLLVDWLDEWTTGWAWVPRFGDRIQAQSSPES
ncbi:MAG: hypothetical protein IT350_03310 [Deltaproteobacteria bacterium]|nr:hypothetical protein [Deltaproteobacteria bacterium]